MIEVAVAGERRWLEFDLIRTFANDEEARAHGALHGIPIELGE